MPVDGEPLGHRGSNRRSYALDRGQLLLGRGDDRVQAAELGGQRAGGGRAEVRRMDNATSTRHSGCDLAFVRASSRLPLADTSPPLVVNSCAAGRPR